MRADQLADALWPHVYADYAHKSFTATLHRLRRIFGEDDTLRLRDGRLGLNGAMFWVDTWALYHLLAELDGRLRDGDARAACQALNGLVEETLARVPSARADTIGDILEVDRDSRAVARELIARGSRTSVLHSLQS